MHRTAHALGIVAYCALLASVFASSRVEAQTLCTRSRVFVVVRHRDGTPEEEGGSVTTARCISRDEYDGMLRAHHTWRCTPVRRGRPPTCTEVGAPGSPTIE